jgi:8-oxo-dGTP pyrophosphatase MutT (NUDIX family)
MIKDYCPGLLDPMAGGVVQYGEDMADNAYREVKEEMGIDGVKLNYVDTFYYEVASYWRCSFL